MHFIQTNSGLFAFTGDSPKFLRLTDEDGNNREEMFSVLISKNNLQLYTNLQLYNNLKTNVIFK